MALQTIEVQNIIRSQVYKRKKDLAYGNEKKEEGLTLKMKKGSLAYKKKKISSGLWIKRDEGGLAQGLKEGMIPKEV